MPTFGRNACATGTHLLHFVLNDPRVAQVEVQVTKVKKLAGEASILVASGKRRYIFDYSATLEWEATVKLASAPSIELPRKLKGTLTLPELSSTITDGCYDKTIKRTKTATPYTADEQKAVDDALINLQAAADAAVAVFVADYQKRVIK